MMREAPPVAGDVAVLDLLRALVVGQQRILHLLEHKIPPSPLTRGDRALLAQLLPAIAGALGSEEFCSRDLTCHSAPALRLVLRQRSAKSIGKLLARAEGIPIADFVVQRRGTELRVGLWRVVGVSIRCESPTAGAPSDEMD